MMDNVQTNYHALQKEPYWLETVAERSDFPQLVTDKVCDIAIIGGGFTGLWAALKAREAFPDSSIVVLEADHCGRGASGRNGGFCAPSISHGVSNAVTRWPNEAETLVRLGRHNLDELAADLDAYGIDAEFEREGKLNVAETPWQKEGLKAMLATYKRFGIDAYYLEGEDLDTRFNSPKYIAGLFEQNYALVNPIKLIDGLCRECLKRGVDIHESTSVTRLLEEKEGLRLITSKGSVQAKKVMMATNASIPILKRLRASIVPIFDYTLMTNPLTEDQLKAIGWEGRYGIADSGNQFHYFRKTSDNRILWGGYDAIYHYGSRRDKALHYRPESFSRLESNFNEAFPALSGVGFSHAWGGIIDTSARTTFFTGTAYSGRLAYAMGFTGQGVSASRFAALTMLDLLSGEATERTQLRMPSSWAVPFPPEPFRYMAIRKAQADLAHEDKTGRRSLLLRSLDYFGIGFDS